MSQLPDGGGPLWGVPGAPPPTHDPVPPFPATPTPSRRRLMPLYVAIAALAVVGGILAVAIVKYPGESADAAATPPATEAPESTAILPGLPTDSPRWTPPEGTTTTPADSLPAGYRLVTGPAGVHVAIPADWSVRQGAVPSNLQADSPTGDGFIRFGGSASTALSLLDTVATNETGNTNITNGYQRLQLAPVSSLPVEAVDWEFLFVKDGVTRHSYGRYWRLDGIDYVVYASTAAELWYAMTDIIDVMIRTAGPI